MICVYFKSVVGESASHHLDENSSVDHFLNVLLRKLTASRTVKTIKTFSNDFKCFLRFNNVRRRKKIYKNEKHCKNI